MCRYAVLATVIMCLLGLTNAFASDAKITIERDIAYGDHEHQMMDIYSPATVRPDTPVIVFFHGGAWKDGDKTDVSEAGESFAESGVIFVSANYRLFPDARFPGFVEDAAAAVALALDSLRPLFGKAHPLFLSGWSAGAYNAALLTYDSRFLERHGIGADTVKGLIGLSGPYEGGLCAGFRCKHIFPDEARGDWHVAGHVKRGAPPALLIVAKEDPYVPARHHEDLVSALESAGNLATVHVLPTDSHFASQDAIRKEGNVVRDLIDDFLRSSTTWH